MTLVLAKGKSDKPIFLTINNYCHKDWKDIYADYNVTFKKQLNFGDKTWNKFFEEEQEEEYFKQLEKSFSIILKKTIEKNIKIFPYPDLVFDTFNHCSFKNIKVVFIGQDPYFNCRTHNKKDIPEAMGLCFSVPSGIKIPPSLQNIYKNLKTFGHFQFMPEHGNLIFWALQGCLMLNTALTVQEGKANSHSDKWQSLTDKIISLISDKLDNVVFVAWGANALKKIQLIDQKKHGVIISSHPSPLSVDKQFGSDTNGDKYPSFKEHDHFGLINKYLKEHKKEEIIWQII